MSDIDFVFKNLTGDQDFTEEFFYSVLKSAAETLNMADKKIELGLTLIGEARMRKMNRKYRGKNRVTDVLSFPLEDNQSKKYGILALGDIFICLPYAKKSAKDINVHTDEELKRLCVHGFLHLLGYDHEKSAADADKMQALENKILESVFSILY